MILEDVLESINYCIFCMDGLNFAHCYFGKRLDFNYLSTSTYVRDFISGSRVRYSLGFQQGKKDELVVTNRNLVVIPIVISMVLRKIRRKGSRTKHVKNLVSSNEIP